MNPFLVGTLLAFAALGAFARLQTVRLADCRADAAAQKAQVTVLTGQVEEQNRAVQGFVQTAQERSKRAAAALAQVQAGQRSHEAEKARLEALLAAAKAPPKPSEPARTCGQAWAEIRAK